MRERRRGVELVDVDALLGGVELVDVDVRLLDGGTSPRGFTRAAVRARRCATVASRRGGGEGGRGGGVELVDVDALLLGCSGVPGVVHANRT